MAVSDSTLYPPASISRRNVFPFSRRDRSRPGSRSRRPSETSVAPAIAGGRPVLKIKGRHLLMK